MGIKVGHSILHRLVEKTDLPLSQAEGKVEEVSVDGGKICLRSEETGKGEWRDYKLVSFQGGICEAFFQDGEGLVAWTEEQPLSPLLTCVGDGHPGIWKVIESIGGKSPPIKRCILDWYHLKENLYKVGGSLKRLAGVENLLWHGWTDAAKEAFEGLKGKRASRFQSYLENHRDHIPSYYQCQQLGIGIGSGDVESKIKQVGARVKLVGARWKRENVTQILRLRCAYLNQSSLLSIITHS